MTLRLGAEAVAGDGVRERSFSFDEDGERVPGVLWLPPAARGPEPRPLVLGGHGFRLDKRFPFPTPSLRSLAERGCAVAILDAPGHGERADADRDPDPATSAYHRHWRTHAGSRIAREYAAAARLLRAAPGIGAGPVGYWGLSLATQYGLAYVARRARRPDEAVRAAVLGLFGRGPVVAHYASRVRCPVFFVQQLEDEIHPAAGVRALFDALASPVKELASSPGAHVDVPDDVRRRAVDFMLQHLGAGARRSPPLAPGEPRAG